MHVHAHVHSCAHTCAHAVPAHMHIGVHIEMHVCTGHTCTHMCTQSSVVTRWTSVVGEDQRKCSAGPACGVVPPIPDRAGEIALESTLVPRGTCEDAVG